MMNRTAYKSLCTEYYDMTKPYASGSEVAFYTSRLQGKKILEAMCGSGRLLIPLLAAGLDVDGVDYSAEMLTSCRERAAQQGLTPSLREQSLEELSLPAAYDAILIAIGSFQLIHGRDKAITILSRLKQHLRPGGRLFIETFVPWEALYENAAHDVSKSEVTMPDGSVITLVCDNHANVTEQYYAGKNTYQKIKDGTVIATEEEEMTVCWYYRYEMQYFLEKAGFSNITIHDVDFSQNPKGIVYEARNE